MRVYYKGAFACIYVVYSILRGHGDIRRLRGHRNMVWYLVTNYTNAQKIVFYINILNGYLVI